MLNGFKKLGPFRGVVLSLESATRPARHSLEARFVVRLLVRTIKEMSADDATHMAAGVSYYALFSLFPLFLFLIAALSLVLETDDIRLRLIDAFSGYFPGSGQLINANLEAVLKVRGALGVFGVLGLLWSGSAIFGGVSRAVNRAWDVHVDRPFFISKPRQTGDGAGGRIVVLRVSGCWCAGAGSRKLFRCGTPKATLPCWPGSRPRFFR